MADKWIVISDGTPQCLYVGKVELSEEGGRPLMSKDGFLTLHECRYLRTMMIPTPQGIQLSNSVMSIGVSRGPTVVALQPAMYYWPDQNSEDMAILMKQIEICEKEETAHRAQAAGITLAGSVPRIGRLTE